MKLHRQSWLLLIWEVKILFLTHKKQKGKDWCIIHLVQNYTAIPHSLLNYSSVCVCVSQSEKLSRPPCCTSQITLPGRGAQLSLSVPDFHFLHCGIPPVSLYLILLYLHLFFLILCHFQFGSPLLRSFFFLPPRPCSLISLIFSDPTWHSFSICYFLSHPHTPHPPSPPLFSLFPSLSHPSLIPSVLKGKESLLLIWGTIEDRLCALGDICLCMHMCHVSMS